MGAFACDPGEAKRLTAQVPLLCGVLPAPGFGLFDVEQFLTAYNYWYYPSGLSQFVAAYVAFGVAFSLAMHHEWLRARGWLRGRIGLAGRVGLQS